MILHITLSYCNTLIKIDDLIYGQMLTFICMSVKRHVSLFSILLPRALTLVGGDGSISSLAASQSQSDAELMTTLVHKDDKPAVEADYERGRWDYSKKGVLRTKPGMPQSSTEVYS